MLSRTNVQVIIACLPSRVPRENPVDRESYKCTPAELHVLTTARLDELTCMARQSEIQTKESQ